MSRVMLRRTPMQARVTKSEVPPKEMKGSVMPLVGSRATTTLMLKNAWMRTALVRPKAMKRAKGSVER
jgi:hypothetical protein